MMQSVGEVMAIGRTFPESFQKALRSLETGRAGPQRRPGRARVRRPHRRRARAPRGDAHARAAVPARGRAAPGRVGRAALTRPPASTRGSSTRSSRSARRAAWLVGTSAVDDLSRARLAAGQAAGLLRRAAVVPLGRSREHEVFAARRAAGVEVTYKTVDTCAAEFAARTPYHYGTYEDEDEVAPLDRPAVVILGSGPNRIGQGVEFDYCCVHAAFALSDAGYETVMVNCNPETVSTDYDTSDRLFFEPLTPEDVLAVCRRLQERSSDAGGLAGVIVALGGQTPLKLARTLEAAGIPVLGTSPDSIDLAEDRERFQQLCERLGIAQPPGGIAGTPASGARDRRAARLPGARAAVVRAGWARDADRLRRRQPRRGDGRAGHRGLARA